MKAIQEIHKRFQEIKYGIEGKGKPLIELKQIKDNLLLKITKDLNLGFKPKIIEGVWYELKNGHLSMLKKDIKDIDNLTKVYWKNLENQLQKSLKKYSELIILIEQKIKRINLILYEVQTNISRRQDLELKVDKFQSQESTLKMNELLKENMENIFQNNLINSKCLNVQQLNSFRQIINIQDKIQYIISLLSKKRNKKCRECQQYQYEVQIYHKYILQLQKMMERQLKKYDKEMEIFKKCQAK